MKGRLGYNAMEAHKHLYDYILYDSTNERDFATELDTSKDVAVYVKLPSGFFISTPVGKYNPDWAIAFYEGTVKHEQQHRACVEKAQDKNEYPKDMASDHRCPYAC